MNKKIFFTAVITCLFSCVSLTACNNTEPHIHVYSEEFSLNETQHWNECSCGKIINLEVHEYLDIINDKYIKEPATYETPAIYYKSCKCGKLSSVTFEGEKLPSEYLGTSYKLDFVLLGMGEFYIDFGTSYDSAREKIDTFLDLNNCMVNKICVSLNDITGIFMENIHNKWEMSEWAKDILFNDDGWSYINNLQLFEESNLGLYGEINGVCSLNAYESNNYYFHYKSDSTEKTSYLITVLDKDNNAIDADITIFDQNLNTVEHLTIGRSKEVSLDEDFYFIISTYGEQDIDVVVSRFIESSVSIGFDSSHLSVAVRMETDKVYAFNLSVSAAGNNVQIMQSAGEIISIIDSENGNSFNLKENSKNIYELPSDEYIIFVKCERVDGNYRLQYTTGKYVAE